MAAFSFKDHVVKLVSDASGTTLEKRVFSGNKLGVEPGPKTSIMKGFDPRPFGIIYGSAEPKWSFDGLSAPEVQDLVLFVGKLYGKQFSISIVIQRPGQTTRHLKLAGCAIGEGGDWNADEGAGATGKLGGPMQDVFFAIGNAPLQSIYANRLR